MDFWNKLDKLIEISEIVIDRKQGKPHPRFPKFIYPLDYGYLKNTKSTDGDEIDVWMGSLSGKKLIGIVCTVDLLKRDTEVKLLIDCTNEEIHIIEKFHNDSEYMSGLLIRR